MHAFFVVYVERILKSVEAYVVKRTSDRFSLLSTLLERLGTSFEKTTKGLKASAATAGLDQPEEITNLIVHQVTDQWQKLVTNIDFRIQPGELGRLLHDETVDATVIEDLRFLIIQYANSAVAESFEGNRL